MPGAPRRARVCSWLHALNRRSVASCPIRRCSARTTGSPALRFGDRHLGGAFGQLCHAMCLGDRFHQPRQPVPARRPHRPSTGLRAACPTWFSPAASWGIGHSRPEVEPLPRERLRLTPGALRWSGPASPAAPASDSSPALREGLEHVRLGQPRRGESALAVAADGEVVAERRALAFADALSVRFTLLIANNPYSGKKRSP